MSAFFPSGLLPSSHKGPFHPFETVGFSLRFRMPGNVLFLELEEPRYDLYVQPKKCLRIIVTSSDSIH